MNGYVFTAIEETRMSFTDQYRALEQEFRARAGKDNEQYGKETGIYLPNIPPSAPVDFVLVGMDPSLGRWATGTTKTERFEKARERIESGFRNFAWSAEDFILHFCAEKYLCQDEATYYITDCAKGAMLGDNAAKDRANRWQRWYQLLHEELQLVAQSNAPVIAIGKEVHSFLGWQMLPNVAGWIPHFSGQAAASGVWQRLPQKNKQRFCEFSHTVSWTQIEETAERVMSEGGIPDIPGTLDRLGRGAKLTDARKQLMFTYKVQFERVRKAAGLQ